MKIILIFIVLSIINVIFSTARSLLTINGGKWIASIMNASYFAFYNIVLIYTVADFPLWIKCVVTFGANLVGVFIVKYYEEKHRPERLWKCELALPMSVAPDAGDIVKKHLNHRGIECNYNALGKWWIFNCYCETKEQTKTVKWLAKKYNGRLSAYESAPL